MSGRGPAPKDPAKRRRQNADPVPATVVTAHGQIFGPALPDDLDWPAQTRRWWETWRHSPQAEAMTATDWDFLLDTALLHAKLWEGAVGVAPELRLRVAKFGATPEDRARLRLQVGDPAEVKPAPPVSQYGHLRAVRG